MQKLEEKFPYFENNEIVASSPNDEWVRDTRTHQLYLILGDIFYNTGVFDDPECIRILDFASRGFTKDKGDIIPFDFSQILSRNQKNISVI